MIRRNDSMRSFRLEKAVRPVGRPEKKVSFRLRSDCQSFKMCK